MLRIKTKIRLTIGLLAARVCFSPEGKQIDEHTRATSLLLIEARLRVMEAVIRDLRLLLLLIKKKDNPRLRSNRGRELDFAHL